MAKPLDREVQMAQIISSAHYQSGDAFTSPVVASLLSCTVSQARDLLNHLSTTGQVVKRQERSRQGGKRTGTTLYQKPPPMILRKAWRRVSNKDLSIQEFTLCQR